jgi:DNA (cytosine-5)-methyltransferase 1
VGASPLRFEGVALIQKPNYVSLFTGAGCLDIGLERAGFKALSFCEIEEVFCKTLEANRGCTHVDEIDYFKKTRILNADIRDLSGTDLAFDIDLDLVVGGPPCQAFSSAGKQLSVLDPRGTLVNEFIRIVHELRSRMFLFENVRGLVTARDSNGEPGGVIRSLLNRFQELGYSCRATLLNSADFGAYQRRVRCFIVGSMQGTAPLFPEPTHQKTAGMFDQQWRSLRSFLEEHADPDEDSYIFPTEKLGQQLRNLLGGTGLKSTGRAEKTRPG